MAVVPEDTVPRYTVPEDTRENVLRLVTVHSLTWLAVGNAVGLLLATLLLVPRLGDWIAPLTYGRWMPLHLDLQFYGWCTLPLVALLYHLYLPPRPGRLPSVAVGLWSGSLLFSAVSWLSGHSSGKLYLDWQGAARWALALGLAALALAIIHAYGRTLLEWRRMSATSGRARGDGRIPRQGLLLRAAGILLLVPAPFLLFLATSQRVYQPVNPAGGGATHTSTLGSVLGVVLIVLLLPSLLGLQPATPVRRFVVRLRWPAVLLGFHFLVFALLDHGDVSHREPLQWLSLVTLLPWLPLLTAYYRRFAWPRAARPWLRAMVVWGAVLLLTGLFAGLPGGQELWKFTNALVGHVHAALAGLVSCWLALLLLMLAVLQNGSRREDRSPRTPFEDGSAFWAWQLGGAVHVAALLVLGTFEGLDPHLLTTRGTGVVFAYACRWLGGLAMFIAAARWLIAGLRLSVPQRKLTEILSHDLHSPDSFSSEPNPHLVPSPALQSRRRGS